MYFELGKVSSCVRSGRCFCSRSVVTGAAAEAEVDAIGDVDDGGGVVLVEASMTATSSAYMQSIAFLQSSASSTLISSSGVGGRETQGGCGALRGCMNASVGSCSESSATCAMGKIGICASASSSSSSSSTSASMFAVTNDAEEGETGNVSPEAEVEAEVHE